MKKKVNHIDYSKASLPRTRRVQFGDCFKMNYLLILKCGLMLLLFFSPLIGFSIFADLYYVSLVSNSTEAIKETILIYDYLLNLGFILLSLVAIVGITGVIYVLRNFIWGEGIFFGSDFARGIKQNAGKNTLFAVVFGIFYALAFFVYSVFPDAIVSLLPLLLFILIFLPVFLWIILLNNFYESKWTSLVRNGLFFYVRNIGWSILGILMLIFSIGWLFIPYELLLSIIPFEIAWLKYVISVVGIVFLLPITLLAVVLFSTAKFDENINKDNYLDYYLRGLNHD